MLPFVKRCSPCREKPDKTSARRLRMPPADFVFPNVPPGEYSLAGGARGYLLLTEETARQPRRSGTVVSLAPGQKLSAIVLRLTPSAAVSGRIVDEDGEALGNVQMQLWHITYRNGRRELAAEYDRKVSTDDRGIYRIAGVTPGRYYLSALHLGPAPNHPPDDMRYSTNLLSAHSTPSPRRRLIWRPAPNWKISASSCPRFKLCTSAGMC